MKISEIKINPNNPRVIRDERFEKLKKSIEEFPKMMKLRPMVVNQDNVVLGGNMRLKALKELGYKEIPDDWVKRADELTEDEQRRFIIVDNVGFGDNDWEMLHAEFNPKLTIKKNGILQK
jgi:ParB-like chromosome segregation protein Spo0J